MLGYTAPGSASPWDSRCISFSVFFVIGGIASRADGERRLARSAVVRARRVGFRSVGGVLLLSSLILYIYIYNSLSLYIYIYIYIHTYFVNSPFTLTASGDALGVLLCELGASGSNAAHTSARYSATR